MKSGRIILAVVATAALAAVAGGAWWVRTLGPVPGLADVSFQVEGQTFRAHRLVLTSAVDQTRAAEKAVEEVLRNVPIPPKR